MSTQTFEVHYGTSVKVLTGLGLVLIVFVAIGGHFMFPHLHDTFFVVFFAVMLAVVLVRLRWSILRGYTLDEAGLHVVRPAGPLLIVKTVSAVATFEPLKFVWGTRPAGAGFCCLMGWYLVPGRGFFWIFATDLSNLVFLQTERGRVLVSPARRDDFIAAVRARYGIAS